MLSRPDLKTRFGVIVSPGWRQPRGFAKVETVKSWIFSYFCVILLLTPLANAAAAPENLGTFRFQELSLAPSLELQEPSQGGFTLKDSWISVQWTKDERMRGVFRLGTLDTFQAPLWFAAPLTGFGLTEAWVEITSSILNVRVGRQSITDGFEGSFSDGFWLMPPSAVRQKRWVFKRGEGVSFWAESKPWLTQITAHNGEAGANTDAKMWVTGRWQYFSNSSGNGFLLTATQGQTSPTSTSTSAAAAEGFVFNPNDHAKFRYGIASLFHLWKRNYWNLEYGRGDILQVDSKMPYAWGRADLSWNLGGDLNGLLRYEQLQSNLKNSDTIQTVSGVGVLVSSEDQLSSLTLMGFHKEEKPQVYNDEVILIFRLNSSSLGNF